MRKLKVVIILSTKPEIIKLTDSNNYEEFGLPRIFPAHHRTVKMIRELGFDFKKIG